MKVLTNIACEGSSVAAGRGTPIRCAGSWVVTPVYTALALVAFAANSIICRMALGDASIDAASFTTIRLVSGALVLMLIVGTREKDAGQKTPRLVDIGRHAFSLCGALFVCLHQPEHRHRRIDPIWCGAGHHDPGRTLAGRTPPPLGMVRIGDRPIRSHLFVAAGMESAVTVRRYINDDGRHRLGRLLPPRPGRCRPDCSHCRQLPALSSHGPCGQCGGGFLHEPSPRRA